MTRTRRSFFERLYRDSVDPWGFAHDAYEQARYAALLDHVPPGRYPRAFEPGCSVGVLTEMLAERCINVMATDIADAAVRRAATRCRRFRNVEVRQAALPDELPPGPFDLVVFSEIGYYLTAEALEDLARRLHRLVAPGGRLIAVHWTGTSPDHVIGGDDVHVTLGRTLTLDHVAHQRVDDDERGGFVLDAWDCPAETDER